MQRFVPFSNGNSRHNSEITPNTKICMGDVVKITTRNKKLVNSRGTVMYIGYPYPGRGVRYGINLSSEANGDHDGSILFDIKTQKICAPKHYKKYYKRIKKRTFFKARKKHGIFLRKDEITEIERESTLATRFTIEDFVEVRFRGKGQIKFIGPLEHTKQMGVWYGIKLKERRGRHDGTVNGVKYFECVAQYGLHCRLDHLTLIKHSATLGDDISNKLQKGGKWAKVLGTSDEMKKGFVPKKRGNKYVSAVNLNVHMNNLLFEHSAPDDLHPPAPLHMTLTRSTTPSKIDSEPSRITPSSKLGTMTSLSNILPPSIFEQGISVNILPGMHKKESLSSSTGRPLKPSSVKRGGTIQVLPGYQKQFKERKFYDHFDFDEIEDELGDGEFGVVYKCRRVIEEEDEWEYSKTFKSSMNEDSDSDSALYPGDYSDSDSDSALYPGDSPTVGSATPDKMNAGARDEVFAVKKIKKAKFHHLNYQHKQENIKLLQQEIKLLEKIQHLKRRHMEGSQYIIDLIDVFEDRNYLYIVTTFCGGGNLWGYIDEANEENAHSEKNIQRIMQQILEGLAFLHRHNVAHLDIKPDNIMFSSQMEIQLIDFGMSRMIPPLHKAGVLVGTPNFVAPEVIDGFYDKKADIWSVGVLFFMLRFGYPPFFIDQGTNTASNEGANKAGNVLFNAIRKGFSPVVKEGLGAWFNADIVVSDALKDLISAMLEKDLAKRLTAAECLTHPYFKEVTDAKKLPPTIMDALSKFSGQCHFTVMMSRLFAHQIGADQRKELQECWDKFDVDGDGALTLDQFKQVMSKYDHNYKDYQVEAIFESLDWNETDTINFNSLLTAFSYQRLVAVDERLWEAFARLDVNNDGHITKAEIKRVLAMVDPDGFDEGLKYLDEFKAPKNIEQTAKLTPEERRKKNISIFIGDCMIAADWDDDGEIDYEEFLRALHPTFNEGTITPRAFSTPSHSNISEPQFIFQPSLETGINFNQSKQKHDASGDDIKYVSQYKVEQ
eukprot:111800_1